MISDETKPDRPVEYTAEIGWAIAGRVVEGETLRTICADPKMPDKKTLFHWLALHADFRDRYVSAREAQAEDLIFECIGIADDASVDRVEKVRANARVVTVGNPDNLAHCRLRLDVRHWVAERLAPEKYGQTSNENRK